MHHKDIAVAVVGAGFALASVLVVFMGFLISRAETLPAEASTKLKRKYIYAARLGIVPVAAAVIEALAAYGWLFFQGQCLLYFWGWGLVVVAVVFLAYAAISIWMI